MKTSRLVLFLTVLFLLSLPFLSLAQTPGEAATPGFFSKALTWVQNNLIGLLGGSLFTMIPLAIRMKIKSLAHKGSIVMKEIGELCLDSSDFLSVIDNSIKEDGKLVENNVTELVQSGKKLIVQGKDVKISISQK